MPTSSDNINYGPLFEYLVAEEWEQADAVTYDLMLSLAGRTEGWMLPKELASLPVSDVMIIDRLWRLCSGNRFGFSVQAKLYRELDRQSLYEGYENHAKYGAWWDPWAAYWHGRYPNANVERKFASLVGWASREYRGNHDKKWTFRRSDDVPCDLNAPIGNLPSTFRLGGGKSTERKDGGESYGQFWVDEYTYYEWSKDSFVDRDFLRAFYRYFNCF
ncbi:MAG: GUN4 domain-containing protein [Cyanobacteria bacterium J06636_16]